MKRSPLCATAGFMVLAACGDSPTTPPDSAAPFTVIVSDPVAGTDLNAAVARRTVRVAANLATLDPLSFVSLAPGVVPTATSATIRDQRTGESITIPVTEGGFDPVGIPAAAGDTLEISLTLLAGGIAMARSVVPASRPPRVVRTTPQKGRTDVAINATIAVIFSEPVQPTTLDTASIHLLAGGVAVAGSVRPVVGSSMGVTFVPTVPLQPATAYQLVLNDRITDLAGDHLEGSTDFEFTTASSPPAGGPSPWTARTPAPADRYNAASAVVDGILYVIGGADEMTGVVGTVEAYDPATDSWTTRATMPTRREGLALGVVNGIIYAVGGANNGFGWSTLPTVEAYDPAADTWSARASLPTARRALGVGVAGGTLYAVGGEAGAFGTLHALGTVEAYDPATDTWVSRAAMPTARADLGVAVVNGQIYAAGGRGSVARSDVVRTMEVYDPGRNTWTVGAPMVVARSRPAMGVINNMLYAVGGFSGGGAATLASSEAYDVATSAWQAGPPLPDAEGWWNGAGVVSGVLFAVATRGMLAYQP